MASEDTPMEFIVWVETRLAGKTLAVREVAKFDRCAGIAYEEIGLTPQCSSTQIVKDIRRRQIRMVFGKIMVTCRRYIRCTAANFTRCCVSRDASPSCAGGRCARLDQRVTEPRLA